MQDTGLYTPKQLVLRHSWLKFGTLKRYISNRDINGLNKFRAVIALSPQKLLIDEKPFLEWVRSHYSTEGLSTHTK